jgi:cbb3-type cytochrome oxidase subunit 3
VGSIAAVSLVVLAFAGIGVLLCAWAYRTGKRLHRDELPKQVLFPDQNDNLDATRAILRLGAGS